MLNLYKFSFLFTIFSFMLLMNLGIFTLSIVLIWWLFIVAKIHAFKFKNFSTHIKKVTTALLVFLIVLTILWYTIIIFWTNNSTKIQNYDSFDTKEINY